MKTPTYMKSIHTSKLLILLFLLMTAGSSLQLRAQNTLETITLNEASISFSNFSNMGSSYSTAIKGVFPANDGNYYSGWTKGSVQYVSSTNKQVAQFGTSKNGWLKSPTIKSEYGFTVTITYSSESNSQVQIGSETAVIGPTTTAVSQNGKGLTMSATTALTSTTFTITNIGATLLYVSKITITPNSSPSSSGEVTKKNPGISFEQESYTATLGQGFKSPELSNPNSLDITYTSSKTGVATVDDKGAVSLVAAGTTTITASFAGNDNYTAGSASYILTVQQASTPFYRYIKSTDNLVDGSVCLLFCDKISIMASSYHTGKKWLNPSSNKAILTNGDYTGKVNADGLPYEITITEKDGKYALYTSDTYLTPSSGYTTLSTKTTADYAWSINFKSSGAVTIRNLNDQSSTRAIAYDDSFFKNATSGSAVYLFQKQTTLNLKEAAKGWATYYNKDFAYVMPQGVKGYYVTLDESKENLILTLAYDAGAAVPENTPLLLYGKVGKYNPVIVNKTIIPVKGTNYMAGERDSDGYTSAGDNMVYYKLTLDNNGNNIGFYYGANDGAPFVMKNETSAYLALPTKEAQQVRNLILNPDNLTRLSPIEQQKTPEALYDLSGRRIQHPQRGLYIQGGRVVYQK